MNATTEKQAGTGASADVEASEGAGAAAGAGARSLRLDPALRAELEAMYADAAAALDEERFDDWLEFFVDDCLYVVQPRENFDRGLPLATMMLESRGMLRDRVYAVRETLFHAPYRQRHVIGPLRATAATPDASAPESLRIEASYAVFRTKVQEPSEVFNVGRTIDRWLRADRAADDPPGSTGRWLLAERRVVFDSDLIANSLIYPI